MYIHRNKVYTEGSPHFVDLTNVDIKELTPVTLPSEAEGCEVKYEKGGWLRKSTSTMTQEAITFARNNNLAALFAAEGLTGEIAFVAATTLTVSEVTGVWTRRVYVQIRDAATGALLDFVNGTIGALLTVADDSVAGTASVVGNVSGDTDALAFDRGVAYFDVSGSNHAWLEDEEVTVTVAALTPPGYGRQIATEDCVITIVA